MWLIISYALRCGDVYCFIRVELYARITCMYMYDDVCSPQRARVLSLGFSNDIQYQVYEVSQDHRQYIYIYAARTRLPTHAFDILLISNRVSTCNIYKPIPAPTKLLLDVTQGQDAKVCKKRNTPTLANEYIHRDRHSAHLHARIGGIDKVMVTWNCCIG